MSIKSAVKNLLSDEEGNFDEANMALSATQVTLGIATVWNGACFVGHLATGDTDAAVGRLAKATSCAAGALAVGAGRRMARVAANKA